MELTLAKAWYGLLANVPRTSAHVTGVASIGRMNTGVSLPGADVAYAVRYVIDAEASETLNVMAEGGTTDHEGNAIPSLASVQGILIEVASGTGTITGGSGVYTVSGITEAGINGPLIEGSGIMAYIDPGGSPLLGTKFYTTDGAASKPVNGHWVTLFRKALIAPSSQTIDDVFPPSNYYAAAKSGDEIGTQLRIGSTDYILLASPARWVLYSDGTNTNTGSTVISAGQEVTLFAGRSDGGDVVEDAEISGGLGAAWLASPTTEYIWILQHAYNNSYFFEGDWRGQGTSPATAAWNTSVYKAGTPVISAADSITYAAGQVVTLIRPDGITTNFADTLTITAATATDITISVIGTAA